MSTHDNPFDGPEDPPEIVVPTPEPRRRPRAHDLAPKRFDVSDVLADINSAARRFNHEITTLFAGVDPRFAAEVRERSQNALLMVAEVLAKHLTGDPTPTPSLTVIRGGRP